jgi:RNA 3'-terminal phosphate cyclase (ATP)
MSSLVIDGSEGEGGGQILRTSLTVALLTGRPFRIENIRRGRAKPGLLRQHLTCVAAAAKVGDAAITGDTLGSTTLSFEPRALRGGDYELSIGTAGSTTLVLQTILPALLRADAPSRVVINGGTHNPAAPPVHFLQRTFLPLLARMGGEVRLTLARVGFYPVGGGKIVADIAPSKALAPLHVPARGPITHRAVHAVLADVPRHVGEREIETICTALGWPREAGRIEHLTRPTSPGNAVFVEVGTDDLVEVFTGFGSRQERAEQVAHGVADEARAYIEGGAAVGPYLADQLLPLLAAGPGGSFATTALTPHARSQIALLKQLGTRPITVGTTEGGLVTVAC